MNASKLYHNITRYFLENKGVTVWIKHDLIEMDQVPFQSPQPTGSIYLKLGRNAVNPLTLTSNPNGNDIDSAILL